SVHPNPGRAPYATHLRLRPIVTCGLMVLAAAWPTRCSARVLPLLCRSRRWRYGNAILSSSSGPPDRFVLVLRAQPPSTERTADRDGPHRDRAWQALHPALGAPVASGEYEGRWPFPTADNPLDCPTPPKFLAALACRGRYRDRQNL